MMSISIATTITRLTFGGCLGLLGGLWMGQSFVLAEVTVEGQAIKGQAITEQIIEAQAIEAQAIEAQVIETQVTGKQAIGEIAAGEKLTIQPPLTDALRTAPLPSATTELAMVCGKGSDDYSAGTRYTADTVCQQGLTPPSLWWTQEELASQLGSRKLVNNWVATREAADQAGRVRLIVNPQAWSLLDYFTRYEFVNSFGLAARDFGYATEVYDSRGAKLASYDCAFREAGKLVSAKSCRIDLGRSQLGFRGTNSRNSLF